MGVLYLLWRWNCTESNCRDLRGTQESSSSRDPTETLIKGCGRGETQNINEPLQRKELSFYWVGNFPSRSSELWRSENSGSVHCGSVPCEQGQFLQRSVHRTFDDISWKFANFLHRLKKKNGFENHLRSRCIKNFETIFKDLFLIVFTLAFLSLFYSWVLRINYLGHFCTFLFN